MAHADRIGERAGFRMLESASTAMRRAISMARRAAAADAPVLLTGESGSGRTSSRAQSTSGAAAPALPDGAVRRAGQRAARGPTRLSGAWPGAHGARPHAGVPGTCLGSDPLPRRGRRPLAAAPGEIAVLSGGPGARTSRRDGRRRSENRLGDSPRPRGRGRRRPLPGRPVLPVERGDIALPPLRERPEDIAALTDYFLARLVARHGRGALHVSPDVRRLLAAHRWDGNVRELVSVLERAVILATGDTIGPDCLPERLARARAPAACELRPRASSPSRSSSASASSRCWRNRRRWAKPPRGWGSIRRRCGGSGSATASREASPPDRPRVESADPHVRCL